MKHMRSHLAAVAVIGLIVVAIGFILFFMKNSRVLFIYTLVIPGSLLVLPILGYEINRICRKK